MWERILIAIAIVGLGVLAYQLFLQAQRRRATRGSLDRPATGRAAVLVFTSPTCAPCKLQQLPIIDRILLDWRDRIDVEIVDITAEPDMAVRYGVWSLPTTIVLDAQRKVIAINQGVAYEHELREQLASAPGFEASHGSEWPNSHIQASAG